MPTLSPASNIGVIFRKKSGLQTCRRAVPRQHCTSMQSADCRPQTGSNGSQVCRVWGRPGRPALKQAQGQGRVCEATPHLVGVKDRDQLVRRDVAAGGVDLLQHVVHVVALAIHLALLAHAACTAVPVIRKGQGNIIRRGRQGTRQPWPWPSAPFRRVLCGAIGIKQQKHSADLRRR
jgi:hypothetical protein